VVLLQKGLTLTWEEATYLKSRAVAHDDEGVRGVEEVSIGEFARRSLLSVKALRLYDELGVLKPARVDDASGYRFYDLDQLADARLVAMLRQLEFPLATSRSCSRAVRSTPQIVSPRNGSKLKPHMNLGAISLHTSSINYEERDPSCTK